jgi:hypothetical protein
MTFVRVADAASQSQNPNPNQSPNFNAEAIKATNRPPSPKHYAAGPDVVRARIRTRMATSHKHSNIEK